MNNDLLEKIAETLIEELDMLDEMSDVEMETSIQASIPMIINSSDEYIKKLKDGDDNARRQVGDFIKTLKQYADGNEAADDKIINNYKDEITDPDGFKKNLKSIVDAYQELVKTEPDAAKEEKPEDDPNDESTETFDINDEDKAALFAAYNDFKDNFYKKRFLKDQAPLVQNLLNIFRKITKEEEKERAIADVPQDKPDQELVPEAKFDFAPDDGAKARDPKQDEKERQDDMARKGVDKRTGERTKTPNEIQATGPELDNIKADVRSFAQVLIDSKEIIKKLKNAVDSGLQAVPTYKREMLKTIESVQVQNQKLYNDLKQLTLGTSKIQEQLTDDEYIQRAKQFRKIYDYITIEIGKFITRLIDNEPLFDEVKPSVAKALEQLEAVVEWFPSIKTFSGEVENIQDVEKQYLSALKKLDFGTSNMQTLVKGQLANSIAVNNFANRIEKFSNELERIFGIKSLIKTVAPSSSQDQPQEPEAKKEIVSNISQIKTLIKPRLFQIYAKSLGLDASTSGEAGRRLREQYNSFIRFYLLLLSSKEVQKEEMLTSRTKSMEIPGVGDIDIEKTLQLLKTKSKQDYKNIVELFGGRVDDDRKHDPRDLRKAFKLVGNYLQNNNIKPKFSDYQKIFNTYFLPLESNENKIVEKLIPIIRKTLRGTHG